MSDKKSKSEEKIDINKDNEINEFHKEKEKKEKIPSMNDKKI